MKIVALAGSICVVAAVTAACSDGGYSMPAGSVVPPAGASTSSTTTTSAPTFYKDIEPILETHCQGCHVQGGIAPMPLITYADAQPYAADMASYTGQKLMPPWGAVATSDCTPTRGWENDPTLTDDQIATIAAWSTAGAPAGDPADAPTSGTPAPIDLANPTTELTPPAPFSLSGSTDEFRCFVLDPKITSTMYMNGAFIVPGNATIVHHVLVYSANESYSATIAELSKNGVTLDASNSYDCFGGPNVSKPSLIAPWAPGGEPMDYPSNAGTELDAGTALIMQVHYHPHANASPNPDSTTFKMRLTATKPAYFIDPVLIGNFTNPVTDGTGLLPDPDDRTSTPEFRIPAYSAAHTETMEFTLPSAEVAGVQPYIYSVGSHEHLVGTAQQITVTRNSLTSATQPANECLLAVPEWNFNWQRGYVYNTPSNTAAITDITQLPAFNGGDMLTIKCTYNNTMQNPALSASLLSQGLTSPSDVYLGETTLDEMCLGFFGIIYKAP